jgi:peptidoglycan/LPS O-acetylase OafA/YrhL
MFFPSTRTRSNRCYSIPEVALKRVSQLDGIRGLAIASVLVDHFSQILNVGIGRNLAVIVIDRFLDAGWMGVDIFFVLSGFLITGIILKDRSKPDFWSNFYLRRAFRILPAFAVVFVLTLVATHYLIPEIHFGASYVIPTIFFLANWTILTSGQMPLLTHLWSLAVEEQFYFLWPQAAKRMKSEHLLALAISLIVLCELTRLTLALLHVGPYIVYNITPTRIDGLSIGAAVAIALTIPRAHAFLARWWRKIAILAAISLPLAFAARHGSLFIFDVWSQVLAIPGAITVTAMLIFAATEGSLPSIPAKFFDNAFLGYMGRRSYALYLIHLPIGVAIQRSRAHGWLAHFFPGLVGNAALILIGVAISFALTEASWHWIESPAQALRVRIMRGRHAHPVAVAQA